MLLCAKDTFRLLKKYGLKSPRTFLCSDRAEVLDAASSMRFPVVLKASSRQETHKTEKGLVQLGIHSLDELSVAFSRLEKKTRAFPVDAFVVQEQALGIEFIVGGHTDPTFGQTVMFGLGGVYAELFDEAIVRVVPFSKTDAVAMIRKTRAAAFFEEGGFRGKKASLPKVVDALLKTSNLIQREKVSSLDFNPLMADEADALIVDARIVIG